MFLVWIKITCNVCYFYIKESIRIIRKMETASRSHELPAELQEQILLSSDPLTCYTLGGCPLLYKWCCHTFKDPIGDPARRALSFSSFFFNKYHTVDKWVLYGCDAYRYCQVYFKDRNGDEEKDMARCFLIYLFHEYKKEVISIVDENKRLLLELFLFTGSIEIMDELLETRDDEAIVDLLYSAVLSIEMESKVSCEMARLILSHIKTRDIAINRRHMTQCVVQTNREDLMDLFFIEDGWDLTSSNIREYGTDHTLKWIRTNHPYFLNMSENHIIKKNEWI